MPGRPGIARCLVTAVLLALGAGCVKRPVDYQREYAQTLRPAELEAPPRQGAGPAPDTRVLRVRAWVDDDFQAQTPRWRERISEQVRRANRVLEPQFGHRLELVEIVSWPRSSRPPDLDSALAQLEATDPGRHVDLVVGYVAGVRMPTNLTESLGLAMLGGRHLVLRSMVWTEEFDEVERVFDLLSPDERNTLVRERRVHREVTILLHEWAHTLGALHESLSASIMADTYHFEAIGFSPGSSRVIEDALRARPRRSPVATTPPPGSSTTRPPAEALGSDTATRPLVPARPLPPNLRPSNLPAAAPGPSSSHRASGRRRLGRSLAELQAAEVALQAGGEAHAQWLLMAREAHALGAPALAERAASRAGTTPEAVFIASDAHRQRREVALPLDGSIPAPREPIYVEAVNKVLDLASEPELPEAREALRALAKAFPGSPGLALATCAVAAAERGAAGAASCAAAVSAFGEAPRSHLLLGVVQGRSGRWAEARGRFQRALALDDSTGEAWSRLAGAHAALGELAALRELEGRYLARFGFALRPSRD